MAVRDDFSPGEVLTSSDLNDTFASKLPYSYGTATPSTSDNGFLWYDSNSTPAEVKFWDGAAFQALTSGKILQIVRATDTTTRSTTSTSFVDSNMSVTITPTKSTSAVLAISTCIVKFEPAAAVARGYVQITDSSNNAVSGAETTYQIGINEPYTNRQQLVQIGYATPATTSATTYKVRFRTGSGGTIVFENSQQTGQMYAIEVSA